MSELDAKAAALERAKSHGWSEPIPYDYSTADRSAGDGGPESTWLSDAAKYEWSDEFGDVGPANPTLEQELYHGEFLLKAGAHVKALSFKIDLQGPERIHPVAKAGVPSNSPCFSG
jgi:ATP-dependent RNA helicase DDX3X